MTGSGAVDLVVDEAGQLTYRELGGRLRHARGGCVHLNLSRLRFIDPAGLVSLAVVAEQAAGSGRPVRFTAPDDPEVAGYLNRMRLGAQLAALSNAVLSLCRS